MPTIRIGRGIRLGPARGDGIRRRLAPLLAGVAAAGCAASRVPIDPALRETLAAEARIDAFVAPPHVFDLTSARFAPLGGMVVVRGGPCLSIEGGETGLYDPALAVREGFGEALAEAGFENVVARTDRFAGEATADPAAPADAPFAFVFETTRWALVSDLVSEVRHRLRYAVEARLERGSDGAVLWRGLAAAGEEAAAPVRSLAEFFEDDAALLRLDLEDIARECASALAADFLGGTGPRHP